MPAARAAFQHVAMMQEAIGQRRDGGDVAQQLSPIVDRSVRGQQR